ncbi:hypothetical protein IT084_15505 [Desulfallas sp. Bu1-1]|uniref:hypothetical protein n=1 Tax=Desulfallas sp. Bu1-1 TaxID=2787620 RepID=UPI00189E1353|nr:hypothetical protein [Desulfallas sp. Bu1-1]MBF7084359.1 hypothetical protein [Desulfallas sp. Bu1-1]
MRRLLGGSFFITATIYMAVSKPPDHITLLAMLLCTVCAMLVTTKQYTWPVVIGGIMIAGSLVMQAALSYRCTDCLKADALILCGIVYLAVFDKSGFKLWTRGTAAGMTLILLTFFILAAPAEQVLNTNTASRYIQASDGSSDTRLDTAEKSVLLFNPKCSACGEVTSKLVQLDPYGEHWIPVQTGGNLQDGRDYLTGKGYQGKLYITKWPGAVPALVTTQENSTVIIRSPDQMIKIIGGGGN